MATLAVNYEILARHINRQFTGGEVYATGTIAVSSGVVTLTGGVFPSWSASGTINVNGSLYTVNTRDSGTQVTLDNTSVTVSSGAAYCLIKSEEYEARSLDDAIRSGLSDFYTPMPAVEGEDPYVWSFLTPSSTLSLTSGDYDINLPADFGTIAGDFTYQDGVNQPPIAVVTEGDLRNMRARDSASGPPRYACIRQKTFDATAGQSWEVLFYPTPDTSYTVEYSYRVSPNHLDPTNDYPYGGPAHGETVLLACMAAAEREFDDAVGAYEQKFQQRLAASMALDFKAKTATTSFYSHIEPDLGSYDWLEQEVGVEKGMGGNPKLWSEPDRRMVRSIIQRGLNQFYMPPAVALGVAQSTHQWSFLRPLATLTTSASYSTGTVTIVAGVVTLASGTFPNWAAGADFEVSGVTYEVASLGSSTSLTLTDTTVSAAAGTSYTLGRSKYDLPADFAGVEGLFTFRPGENLYYEPFGVIAEHRIRAMRQAWDSYDHPRAATIQVKPQNEALGTRHYVQFFPTPDAAYELTYKYRARWKDIGPGQYPPGGTEHAETILASCLSIVEGVKGPRWERFAELLVSSLEMDHRQFTPEKLGPMLENSDAQEGYGYNPYHEPRTIVSFGGVEYD